MKPVALVTCKIGSEDWCVEEVGNVLFPYDFDVEVRRTKYRGLLIVYSKLEVDDAVKILLNGEYGFVKKIIPIHIYTDLGDNGLFDKIVNLTKGEVKVKVKLRVRGVRGLTKELWKRVIGALMVRNILHDPGSRVCLYIEVIDKVIYVGKSSC